MKKRWKLLLLGVGFVIVWYLFSVIQILRYSDSFFDKPSDVALVLGAGSHEGKISRVFEERCHHAIQLYKSNKVKKILITGGYGENQAVSDSRAASRYIQQHGIPDSDILLEEASTRTLENLIFAQEIMQRNDLSSALIVSDPLHMKRAMRMVELIGITALPSPTQTSRYQSFRSQCPFVLREAFYLNKLLLYDQFLHSKPKHDKHEQTR